MDSNHKPDEITPSETSSETDQGSIEAVGHQADQANTDLTQSRSRAEAAILALESEVSQKKRKADKPASRFEPIYMIVFLCFMVLGLGGMAAYMRDPISIANAIGTAPDGLIDRALYDAKAVASGYPIHLAEWWLLDLGIVIGAAIVLLLVKNFVARRRLFKVIATMTIVIYASMMLMAVFSADHPLRQLM